MSDVLIKILFLIVGLFVLFFAISKVDLEEVYGQFSYVGWYGLVLVLIIYFFAFSADSMTWNLTIVSLPFNFQWIARSFAIRLIGEALNNTIPLGGVGGEPAKAVLMRTHYGVAYSEAVASLILVKTINMVSLCIFFIIGFLLLSISQNFSVNLKQGAFLGLLSAIVLTGLLFGAQKTKFSIDFAKLLGYLIKGKYLDNFLNCFKEFNISLANFYGQHRTRLFCGICFGLVNWLLGVIEVYVVMGLLGVPVSFSEAYIIESVAQMVRMGTFFIPMSIGAQEGALLLIVNTVTGSASAGLALGIIRRLREFIWIAFGFLIGIKYSTTKN